MEENSWKALSRSVLVQACKTEAEKREVARWGGERGEREWPRASVSMTGAI